MLRTLTITTVTDLQNWVRNHIGDATSEDIERAVEAIRADSAASDWGKDWSGYLGSINLIATALRGEVVRKE